jgi:hypothetical protein
MTSILAVTFNQGNANNVNKDKLYKLMNLEEYKNKDIIVFSLQESSDYSITNNLQLIMYNHILIFNEYMYQFNLGKLKMFVWLKKSISYNIIKTNTTRCKSSFFNIQPAKGFIYIVFNIIQANKTKKIAICNTHLASAPDDTYKRTKCLQQLYKAINHYKPNNIFIMGDLNYRTTSLNPLTIDQKKSISTYKCDNNLIKSTNTLCGPNPNIDNCSGDECHICKKMKNIDPLENVLNIDLKHTKLQEANITFCPTCRFKENIYPRQYDAKRYPSYCDRILYTGDIKVHTYDSYDISYSSDHHAVLLNSTF